MQGRRIAFAGFLAAASLAAADGRPVVFVSIPPQAWLVKRLAGEAVEVRTLMPPGADPHTFEPGARQVRKLADATLYLTLGMPFERSLAARASALSPALRVVGIDAGIDKIRAGEHAHEGGHACSADGSDPHIWLSPRRFAAMASNTVAALTQALPQRRGEWAANLDRAVGEIGEAGRAVRAAADAATIKTWVAYHPSWSYFAADYGLSLLVIEEDGKAPSARHLAETIRTARAAGAQTVLAEPQHDRRPSQTLADQLGARLVCLDPLQEDWLALMRAAAETLAGT